MANSATVTALTGHAWIRNSDGSRTELHLGSKVPPGSEIITEANGQLQMMVDGGNQPITLGGGRDVAYAGEMSAAVQDVSQSQAQVPTGTDSDRLLQALNSGQDLLANLESAGAVGGGGGGGGAGGSSDAGFVVLSRLAVGTSPLGWGYPSSLPTVPELQVPPAVEQPVAAQALIPAAPEVAPTVTLTAGTVPTMTASDALTAHGSQFTAGNNDSVTANFAGIFGVQETAGSAAITSTTQTFSLVAGNADTGLTSHGVAVLLTQDANGNLVGMAGNTVVFTITINGQTGDVTLHQIGAIDHSATNPGSGAGLLETLQSGSVLIRETVTATDANGNTGSQTAQADVSHAFAFTDDAPTVNVSAATNTGDIVLQTSDAQLPDGTGHQQGVPDQASADFSGLFKVQFNMGADDGQGSSNGVQYSLSVGNPQPSGLSSEGSPITLTLSQDGAEIDGRDSHGNLVFTVTVDASGKVTLTQFDAIDHVKSAGGDVLASLKDAGITLTATGTITDDDGDTATSSASVNIGDALQFSDDAPSVDVGVVANPHIPTLETSDAKLPDGTDHHQGVRDQASADFSGLFSVHFNMGADDGQGSSETVTYTLSLEQSKPSGLSSEGSPITLTLSHNGTEIDGRDSHGNLVFTVTVDASGKVTLTQFDAIDHVKSAGDDVLASLKDAGIILTATGTITDSDGDSQTNSASVNIGGLLKFGDDVPTVDVGVVSHPHIPTLETSDAKLPDGTDHHQGALDQATANFSGLFSVHFDMGADDGKGSSESVNYTLSVEHAKPSGLSSEGSPITLTLSHNGTEIDGRDSHGNLVFTVTVDAKGNITLTQFDAIDHVKSAGNDVLASLKDAGIILTATGTITDSDGDTRTDSASANIGAALKFGDDVPTVDVDVASHPNIPTLQTSDASLPDGTAYHQGAQDQASADFSGLFNVHFNMGADDGAGKSESLTYTLSVADSKPSGLSSEGSPITLTLSHNGTEIDGRDSHGNLVFTVTVDESGKVTLTQFDAIDHVKSAGEDLLASLKDAGITLTATGTITDSDGDTRTDSASANIGGALQFADDTPQVVSGADTSVTVTSLGHEFTGSLGVNVGADDAAFTGSKLGVTFNVANGSAVTTNDGSGAILSSNGHALEWQHVDINGNTITVDSNGSGLAAGYYDANNHWVSVLTVTGNAKDGTYTVEEYAPVSVSGGTTGHAATVTWNADAHPGHAPEVSVSDSSSQYSLVFTANTGVTFLGTATPGESRSAVEHDGSSADVNTSGNGTGVGNNWITSSSEILNVHVENSTGHAAETNSLTLGLNLHGGGETTVMWYAYEGNTLVASGTASFDAVRGDHAGSLTINTGGASFDNVVLTAGDDSAGFRVDVSGSSMDVSTPVSAPATSVSVGTTVTDDDGDSVNQNIDINLHTASASVGADSSATVYEAGLPGGSHVVDGNPVDGSSATGASSFHVDATDGVKTISVEGHTFNLVYDSAAHDYSLTLSSSDSGAGVTLDSSGHYQIADSHGTLTLTGYTSTGGSEGASTGGDVAYSYTLTSPLTNLTPDNPSNVNGLTSTDGTVSINVSVTGNTGSSGAGAISIDIKDDAPTITGGAANLVETGVIGAATIGQVNLQLVLDFSTSMNESDGHGSTKIKDLQHAVLDLLTKYNGGTAPTGDGANANVMVDIVTFGTHASTAGSSTWMTLADAYAWASKDSNFNIGGIQYTNYQDALHDAAGNWQSGSNTSTATNVSFFISDGDPTATGTGSHVTTNLNGIPLTGSDLADWTALQSTGNNGIGLQTYAVGIDATSTFEQGQLTQIAGNVPGHVITGVAGSDLPDALTELAPAHVTGSIFSAVNTVDATHPYGTGTAASPNSGANGSADGTHIGSFTINGVTYVDNGNGTFTGNDAAHTLLTVNSSGNVTVNTTFAGDSAASTFVLNVANDANLGQFSLSTSHAGSTAVTYTLVDGDGDTANGRITVNLIGVTDDHVITNMTGDTVAIDGAALLANDPGTAGMSLANPATVATNWGTVEHGNAAVVANNTNLLAHWGDFTSAAGTLNAQNADAHGGSGSLSVNFSSGSTYGTDLSGSFNSSGNLNLTVNGVPYYSSGNHPTETFKVTLEAGETLTLNGLNAIGEGGNKSSGSDTIQISSNGSSWSSLNASSSYTASSDGTYYIRIVDGTSNYQGNTGGRHYAHDDTISLSISPAEQESFSMTRNMFEQAPSASGVSVDTLALASAAPTATLTISGHLGDSSATSVPSSLTAAYEDVFGGTQATGLTLHAGETLSISTAALSSADVVQYGTYGSNGALTWHTMTQVNGGWVDAGTGHLVNADATGDVTYALRVINLESSGSHGSDSGAAENYTMTLTIGYNGWQTQAADNTGSGTYAVDGETGNITATHVDGQSITADQLNGEILQGNGQSTTMTGYNADGSHGAQASGNVFVSESGHDTMIGNLSGNDTFVLNLGNASAPGGQDVIQHFLGSDGTQHNDVLNLSEVLNVASSDIGTSAISNHLSIAEDGSGNAVLSFTPNVAGQPAAAQSIELQGVSISQLDSAFGVSGADADHSKLINAMIEQGKVQISSH